MPSRPRRAAAARALAAVSAALLVAACASTSPRPADNQQRQQRIAEIALELRGEPYRFGGDGDTGFDCSGLVHYAFEQVGASVPRTAEAQYDAVRPVYRDNLRPGDLVFFRTDGVFVSHVGIYVGDGRFVHALNPDRPVTVAELDSPYWSERLVRAGSLAL